jgi:hypothetical protein
VRHHDSSRFVSHGAPPPVECASQVPDTAVAPRSIESETVVTAGVRSERPGLFERKDTGLKSTARRNTDQSSFFPIL